jgi:cytochrome c556
MRYLAAAMVLCTGGAVLAQDYPLFGADNLDEAMKGVGRQFSLLTRLVEAGDFEEAKVRVTRTREQLSPTITFWRKNGRDDAIGMVRDAAGRLDELDVALSDLTVDPDAVGAALGAVEAACQACHGVYREADPAAADTFRLKRWSGG